jgi:hypothetical protein
METGCLLSVRSLLDSETKKERKGPCSFSSVGAKGVESGDKRPQAHFNPDS